MSKITVLLADDHAVVRDGLRALLDATDEIKVVGEAENGRQAVQLTKNLQPNVVVMDVAMPQLNGIEATRQISRESPGVKVLILSSYTDDENVAQVLEYGATGYLAKEAASKDLIKAIHEAHKGNAFFSPRLSKCLMLQQYRKSSAREERFRTNGARLTVRQMEVLQLIAEGYATKQVAHLLGVSIKTAQKHRQQLMDTLGIHHAAGLTRYAAAHGVIERLVPLPATQYVERCFFLH